MATLVEAPDRSTRVGGIESVVGSFTGEDRVISALGSGGLVWEDSTCGLPSETKSGCYDTVTPAADKQFDGVTEYGTIGSVTLYAGVECLIGGDSVGDSFMEQAEGKLSAGEGRGVEELLVEWATGATSTEVAADIVAAVGAAEQHADQNYVGRPVILMSRASAVLAKAKGIVKNEGDRLTTVNGSPVIATGKFTGTGVAIVGAISVYASEARSYEAPKLSENSDRALAERSYAVGVDCEYRHTVTIGATP